MDIEFDPDKDAVNRAKHRISLAFAVEVMADPLALAIPDARFDYAETRTVTMAPSTTGSMSLSIPGAAMRSASFPSERPTNVSNADTIRLRTLPDGSVVRVLPDGSTEPHAIERPDLARLDAMTDAEITVAAEGDPDNPPLTDKHLARLCRTWPVATGAEIRALRERLGLSQDAFAARYGIPAGTLRGWEQGRRAPDTAMRAYLKVIDRDPVAVDRALAS